MGFFNLSVFRFQVYSLQSIDSNIYLFCFMYFQINSKRVSIGSFFPLFLGQLTVPHDVISSSGVGDSALPGHPGAEYVENIFSRSLRKTSPQRNGHNKKLSKFTKLQFLNDKIYKKAIRHLEIWQNWCFGHF